MVTAPVIPGIYGFTGMTGFLSNFWPAVVELDGLEYPTVEHAYVAAKTTDADIRNKIRQMPVHQAGKAKRFGRTFNLRHDWEDVKVDIMLNLLRQKFSHPDLQDKLLGTYDFYLEETNTWGDTFWGVCNGKGKNILGLLLMKVRDEIEMNNLPKKGSH